MFYWIEIVAIDWFNSVVKTEPEKSTARRTSSHVYQLVPDDAFYSVLQEVKLRQWCYIADNMWWILKSGQLIQISIHYYFSKSTFNVGNLFYWSYFTWECIKNNKVKSSSSLGHLKKNNNTKTKTVCVFAGLIETLHLKLPAT